MEGIWKVFGTFAGVRAFTTLVALIGLHKVLAALARLSKSKQPARRLVTEHAGEGDAIWNTRPSEIRKDLLTHRFLSESRVFNAQGLGLFRTCRFPASGSQIRGVVVLVHGFREHVGRYEFVIKVLTHRGFAVYAMDHQAHGRSEGADRSYFEKLQHLVDDVIDLAKSARDQVAAVHKVPLFLFGHSMGGLISTLVADQTTRTSAPADTAECDLIDWAGVVLSAPALGSEDPIANSPTAFALFGIFSQVLPKLRPKGIDPIVCRDPVVVDAYLNDPLIPHGGLHVRVGYEMISAMKAVMANVAPRTTWNYLLIQGQEDRLCAPAAPPLFHAQTKSEDKTLHMQPGSGHELLNDKCGDAILYLICSWLDDRTPQS